MKQLGHNHQQYGTLVSQAVSLPAMPLCFLYSFFILKIYLFIYCYFFCMWFIFKGCYPSILLMILWTTHYFLNKSCFGVNHPVSVAQLKSLSDSMVIKFQGLEGYLNAWNSAISYRGENWGNDIILHVI